MRVRVATFMLLCAGATAAERPNVLVIMADDLGFGDVGCYGAETIDTPNIDRLAREGLRFTNGYCSASTCTPTRFSFLTGEYAFRRPGTGIAPPNSPALIPPGTETVASILSRAGYATAVIGKWHLGLGERPGGPDWNGELNPGPLEIGFDHCFLLPTTNDRVPSVYVEGHRVRGLDPEDPLHVGRTPIPGEPTGETDRDALKMNWSHGHNQTVHNGIGRIGYFSGGTAARWRDEDLADAWVDESVKWLEQSRDRPFFLFFSSHDIHVPRMPHERFHGATPHGFRGDAIAQLDWCVGQLLDTLDRLELTEETFVLFCSDNGPVLDDGYQDGAVELLGDHAPAGPYRGGKYSIYEGGTRTPFITRWPGRIEPGVSDEVVCTIDVAASVAALVEQPLAEGDCIDSMDLSNALLGAPEAAGRDHLVQQGNRARNLALRVGDWKILEQGRGKERKIVLYDLAGDPAETIDVAKENPAVVAELRDRLARIRAAGTRE